MSKTKLFFTSVGATTIVLLILIYFSRPPELRQLSDGVFVSAQLKNRDMGRLRRDGINTVVDLRPDGEAPGQPTSVEMNVFVRGHGMGFFYIPVPHEEIPDKAVAELADVIKHQPKPFVLYCRTGRRAARTFAL